MHFAVEVGELEIGSLGRGEGGAARRSSLAEIPDPVFVIVDDRLSELSREGSEIEPASTIANKFRCARGRYRDADLTLTRTLRFELPSAHLCEIGSIEP